MNLPHSEKTGWPWTEGSESLPPTMPDGSPWPKISIVTPSYNQVQYLEETIRSVLLQGYPNLEYIIIDGGSTDGSVEIIKKYEPWLTYWVTEKDKGQSNAINKGFRHASGELIGWINSDDIFFPLAFKEVVFYWVENDRPKALITGTKLKGNSTLDKISRLEQFPHTIKHLLEKNIIEQPSTFYPVELLKEVGYIDERYKMSMDYDLWLRMAKQGADLIFLNKDLAVTRVYPETKTSRFRQRSLFEVLQSVWRNFRVIPEPWLKKFITVMVVPDGIKSTLLKKLFFSNRNIIFLLSVKILKTFNLLDYS